MESKIVESELRKPSYKYPILLESVTGGTVVLFHTERTGMIVARGLTWPLGHYSESWNMQGFRPFTDAVELRN